MGSGMAANTNSKAGIVAKLLEALSAFAHVCKRRIPTVIAVVLLLAVWEAWVRIGNVPSTMIAAPSEIAQATVETWSTLWPATQVTLLEGTVGFLFAVLFGILIGILLYCSCIANAEMCIRDRYGDARTFEGGRLVCGVGHCRRKRSGRGDPQYGFAMEGSAR